MISTTQILRTVALLVGTTLAWNACVAVEVANPRVTGLKRYPLFPESPAPQRALPVPKANEEPAGSEPMRLPVATQSDDESLPQLPPPIRPSTTPPTREVIPTPGSEPSLGPAVPATSPPGHDEQPSHDEFTPEVGCGAYRSPYFAEDFGDAPLNFALSADPAQEAEPYETKTPIATQRPWLELGRPFYDWGPFPPSSTILGPTNLVAPQFLLYGDYRAAIASRQFKGQSNNQIANRLNLEADLKLTSTGRLHGSMQPLNRGQNFTRVDFDSNGSNFTQAFNTNFVTGYAEADLGAMWGSLTNQVLPYEVPIAIGAMPLLFQNGIWLDDNVIGAAISFPAKNSAVFDISNMDITFFYLFDNINSPAFGADNSAAKAYGVATFIEALDGYIECDYAYLEDRSTLDRSYHNLGLAYTRRYLSFLSNSVRLISNLGQNPNTIEPTADGLVLLVENSIFTDNPYLFVPYFNFFAGFRRPQSVARNGAAGGILRNTGILFESDNLTGYPTLDSSGHEACGGAVGVNLIPATIDRQLVLEYALVHVLDDASFRQARGNQQGIGVRWQRNLSYNWLLRADAMYGFLQADHDIAGARVEARYKF